MTKEEQINLFLKLVDKAKIGGYEIDLNNLPPDQVIEYKIYYKFIFDHAFQKAIWGDLWTSDDGKPLVFNIRKKKTVIDMAKYKPNWQRKCLQMVLAEDYLEFLKNNVE